MKKILPVFAAIAGIVGAATAGSEEVRASAASADAKPLKVLTIGNSFSICCLRQMPPVAKAMGVKLDFVSLYIGGCSLERHCQNVEVGKTNAMFRPYTVSWNYASLEDQSKVPFADVLSDNVWKNWQGEHKEKKGNIPALLKGEKWDVVTIQQASHYSWKPHTYHPWGDDLVKTIRELAPQAKICVQETWSYPPWDGRLGAFAKETGVVGFDQVEMYARLHDAYADFAKSYGFEVIPTGTAAEFMPQRERLFTAPDFHFNGVGEYLQGLVWVSKLFGVDVKECPYAPEFVDPVLAAELREVAQNAVDGVYTRTPQRAFRPARVTRGDTNIMRQQPIDDASWIWAPGDKTTSPRFLKFRKTFDVSAEDGTLVLDVSADERFVLRLDGNFVARGPNRSAVENWQYQTYVANLAPGPHTLEAAVWTLGDTGPLAQLSWRGGFVLKASGAYDEKLTTGKTPWQVGDIRTLEPNGAEAGVWGTGCQWIVRGVGLEDAEPAEWSEAVVVRGGAGAANWVNWGLRTPGWMLFPSQLPDQTETRVCPGAVKAVAYDTGFRGPHVFTAAEAEKTFDITAPLTVPANTRMQFAWDLGRYICAYPEVTIRGGKGGMVAWHWAECARDAKTRLKIGRNDIAGAFLSAYGDQFVSDGRDEAVFTVPWFRCGKWCRVDVVTGEEPMTVSFALRESRYPLEMESEFSSPDDPSLADIRRIAARSMQMCCHEMLFDCPFYEQQMYPGDTRVQLNVLSAMNRDERMIKRAIELYDFATRDDGMCPFNWPTRGLQEGASYTLCYLLMYGDYVMNHTDKAWLRARIPGMRKSMAGLECYENKDGLLENLPGWNFLDWVVGWEGDGTASGCHHGAGLNAELNLFWLLAMQGAAKVESALGNDLQAQYWLAKSEKLKTMIVKKFWNAERGMFVDNPRDKSKCFSEHAQCLALIGEVLPSDEARELFDKLISEKDLKRCTVYFSFYLFETYFRFGRGDLFLKRLDLWRDYVKEGLTTTKEQPDPPGQESRSDCHAWGSHPIWFMQTGLAGIKSDASFFEKVRIAPCPGGLKKIHAVHPHPRGQIRVDLDFDGEKVSGTVSTPVPGVFTFGGRTVELKSGVTEL